MSEVRLVIRDAQREIRAKRHYGLADRVIAALGAEPETIEELDRALDRFAARRRKGTHFRGFSAGGDDRPHDGGLIVVDLTARLVVCDSTCCAAAPKGVVAYHDGKRATDVDVRYRLSDRWLFTHDATDWRERAEARRRDRRLAPPIDVRAALYGEPLLRFVAQRCFDAFRDQGAAAREEDPEREHEYDLVRRIHVEWMMTPRDELEERTPREVVLAGQDLIEGDLRDRADQWSSTDRCPQGLDPESSAYRFAPFGIHEVVVYYDLVRELLWRCRRDVAEYRDNLSPEEPTREAFITGEIRRLERFREQWMESPYEDSDGRTPRSIVHNERARIPEGISGQEAMIDCDCPFCQMQAEMSGPVFWHLDGSHMDDDFAFSFRHDTHEEWEEEKRSWEEFNRRWALREAESERLGVEYPGSGYADPDYLWKASFSASSCSEAPLAIRLFAIGSHLSELIVDLKEPAGETSSDSPEPEEQQALADRLTEAFRRLRKAVRGSESDEARALMPSALGDFRETLEAVAGARPDLALKCVDLRDRLYRFLEPPTEDREADLHGLDELPC
jgi:hypothetical protein